MMHKLETLPRSRTQAKFQNSSILQLFARRSSSASVSAAFSFAFRPNMLRANRVFSSSSFSSSSSWSSVVPAQQDIMHLDCDRRGVIVVPAQFGSRIVLRGGGFRLLVIVVEVWSTLLQASSDRSRCSAVPVEITHRLFTAAAPSKFELYYNNILLAFYPLLHFDFAT